MVIFPISDKILLVKLNGLKFDLLFMFGVSSIN